MSTCTVLIGITMGIAMFVLGAFVRFRRLSKIAWKAQKGINEETFKCIRNLSATIDNLSVYEAARQQKLRH